ncbi:MAG TPA: 16S rRNA (uracil(1498)-N(3))-methyltransferase [Casimicrobiaceae bacterium]|nr:16S rRNA (uracil(1498)-N(3))-methyltransferase [Casimicrobiaceae bacterium]
MAIVTPRFHCPLPLAEGAEIALPDAAAHHAARVLRLAAGDAVTLFGGDDGEFAARILRVEPRRVQVRIGQAQAADRESPLAMTLVQGLAAADRMDYAIQKAVELGVRSIQPVTMMRSVARLDEPRAAKRALHWRQVAIAACEQCGRNQLPRLHPLLGFEAWLGASSEASLRLLLAPDGDVALRSLAAPDGPIEILVGPEGGLTPEESAAALRRGFRALRLGPRILRTDTAGPAVLAALNAQWGDWR